MYYNPRCGTCTKALALLQEQNIQVELIHYMTTPPTVAELKTLLKRLQLPARELLRQRDKNFQKLALDKPDIDDETILKAISDYPSLLQRPIIVDNTRACIARPADKALAFVEK